jgi:hypothetical protein
MDKALLPPLKDKQKIINEFQNIAKTRPQLFTFLDNNKKEFM